KKSPKPPKGTLVVNPVSIHLYAMTKIADIQLTAKNGKAAWNATNSDPQIVLSNVTGEISAGQHATIQVILDRKGITPPGQTVVTVTDGAGRATPVPVTWDLSLF